MTGWLAESNRALRRRLDRAFKRRKQPPPDLWAEVAKSLAELDGTQPPEPGPEQDAAGRAESTGKAP